MAQVSLGRGEVKGQVRKDFDLRGPGRRPGPWVVGFQPEALRA